MRRRAICVAAERMVNTKSPTVVPELMGCCRKAPQDWSAVVVLVVLVVVDVDDIFVCSVLVIRKFCARGFLRGK